MNQQPRYAPMARHLQTKGRGEDTMLIHMTPNEVNSLQGLAMAHGGSLTINPETGLPEAGWLGKLLPTLIGFGLNFIPGVGPLMAAGLTAAGGTLATGNLQKGLMMGLGAFGGASLAGALAPAATAGALGGTAASGATSLGSITTPAATAGATGAGAAGSTSLGAITNSAAGAGGLGAAGAGAGGLGAASGFVPGATIPGSMAGAASGFVPGATIPGAVTPASIAGAPSAFLPGAIVPNAVVPTNTAALTKTPGFMTRFGDAAAVKGIPRGITTGAAGLGLFTNVSDAFSPRAKKPPKEGIENSYEGPYYSEARPATFAPSTSDITTSSKERDYFAVDQPGTYNAAGQLVSPGSNTPAGTEYRRRVLNPNVSKRSPNMYLYEPAYWQQEEEDPYRRGFAGGGSAEKTYVDPNRLANSGSGVTNPYGNYMNLGMFGGMDLSKLMQYAQGAGYGGTSNNSPAASKYPALYAGAGQSVFGSNAPAANSYAYNPYATSTPATTGKPTAAERYPTLYAGSTPPPTTTPYNYGTYPMMAKGGEVPMRDGSFVFDARTVSEIGNGSSNAGKEILARAGGRPLDGPGDGVSDSIPARIGGNQKARVARDEVIMPPEAVRRMGGAKKLYAIMDKAHKARKSAKRGQDTKVARGLGAL